ncbi:MAG: hypothetical protein COB30_013490 [Ectothiorhodospiraceae bacterium]|nr:hypothetical protein [Ectothiorhodospiraceae bacterium]
MPIPDREQQIRMAHAMLINQVVMSCSNSDGRAELESILEIAIQQGWSEMVRVIRMIVSGNRNESLLNGLDEEDTVIVRSILAGLQNPETLPDVNQQGDATQAAPGLAEMIYAASHGDAQALQAVSMMAEQMTQAPGDMGLLGGNIKRLIDGERDADLLCKGMGTSGEQLMLNLIDELNKMGLQ